LCICNESKKKNKNIDLRLIKSCYPELQELLITNKRDLIDNSDKLVYGISEIAANCLKKNFPLSNCRKNQLKEYNFVLRELAKPVSLKNRRKLIIQNGGFLNIILPPLLSALASVAAQQINKRLMKK
jgi:hypothetical protein